MPKFVVKCEVDGSEIGRYEFDCSSVAMPQKLGGGPITIYFDPINDVQHQMEITSLPPNQSNTIGGSDPKTASS